MKKLILAIVVLAIALGSVLTVFGDPPGAILTGEVDETKTAITAGGNAAYGGNITNLDLNTEQQTDRWQGYFGDIDGNITLDQADNETLYRWELSNMAGEVYASNLTAPNWGNLGVANAAACLYADAGDGSEAVNETFTASANAAFDVANVTIAVTSTCSTDLFNTSEVADPGYEENILLDAGQGSEFVWVGFINDQGPCFDGDAVTCDYELIVPDDAENTAADTTTYYFWVEFD